MFRLFDVELAFAAAAAAVAAAKDAYGIMVEGKNVCQLVFWLWPYANLRFNCRGNRRKRCRVDSQ